VRQVPQRRSRPLLAGFEIGDCTQQLSAIAERRNTDLFEFLIGQITQDREINIVLGKAPGILGQAELFEPVRDLLHRAPSAGLHNQVSARRSGKTTKGDSMSHTGASIGLPYSSKNAIFVIPITSQGKKSRQDNTQTGGGNPGASRREDCHGYEIQRVISLSGQKDWPHWASNTRLRWCARSHPSCCRGPRRSG
jgi:hypothetical protein